MLGGSIFIDYNQYVSAFLVEERDDDYWESFEDRGISPSYSSYSGLREKSVPGNTGDWFLNLKAKLRREKWVPFFVLRGQATIANIITIDNLENIFEKNTLEECGLVVHKDGKKYTVK